VEEHFCEHAYELKSEITGCRQQLQVYRSHESRSVCVLYETGK